MSLLQGTIIPGTRLRARSDVPTMDLLRVLGPQIGALYDELMAVDRANLSEQQRRQRDWLAHWLEPVDPKERIYTQGVREL